MTEDEMKTRTCHKTLAPVVWADGNLRFSPQLCIGSDCTAWRWQKSATGKITGLIFKEGIVVNPGTPELEIVGGYCGLAGPL